MGQVPRQPIYVETLIKADLDRVWELTQDTDLHPRWDLRFSKITPTGTTDDGSSRFRYELHIPAHHILGTGISLGGAPTAGRNAHVRSALHHPRPTVTPWGRPWLLALRTDFERNPVHHRL